MITLSAGSTTLPLDPDLYWSDEFQWAATAQSIQRSLTGALIVHTAAKIKGRPISLVPPDDQSAWMTRATLEKLQEWEADPALTLELVLRGKTYNVVFRRHDGEPIEARPVEFVSNPLPGELGDWFLVTIRLMEI